MDVDSTQLSSAPNTSAHAKLDDIAVILTKTSNHFLNQTYDYEASETDYQDITNYTTQQKVLAIVPKFTSLLSIIGSFLIILMILRRKKDERRTYHNLMLGMSISDILVTTSWFVTTWPVPKGTPGAYGAVGNMQTCTAQGFFGQFSITVVMYNATLSLYYFLIIDKGWTDDKISKIEPFFHLNAFAWGIGTCVAGIILELFNPLGWSCYITGYPLGCKESWENNGVTTCNRGDNSKIYQWAFFYAPLWAIMLISTGLMYSVYRCVKNQELRTSAYASHTVETSKKIARQALYYLGAFYVSWTFPTIDKLIYLFTGNISYAIILLSAMLMPMQGFFNLLVYMRPTYLRCKNPQQNFLMAWFKILWLKVTTDTLDLRSKSRKGSSY